MCYRDPDLWEWIDQGIDPKVPPGKITESRLIGSIFRPIFGPITEISHKIV